MESFTLSQVKIDLLRGGSVAQTIAASASNSGSYGWTVPASLQDSSNYKVRVSCATDSAVSISQMDVGRGLPLREKRSYPRDPHPTGSHVLKKHIEY